MQKTVCAHRRLLSAQAQQIKTDQSGRHAQTEGLIERLTSKTDGRVHAPHITKSGRGLVRCHTKRTQEINEHILAPFDVSERKMIADFLEHVRREAEKNPKPLTV